MIRKLVSVTTVALLLLLLCSQAVNALSDTKQSYGIITTINYNNARLDIFYDVCGPVGSGYICPIYAGFFSQREQTSEQHNFDMIERDAFSVTRVDVYDPAGHFLFSKKYLKSSLGISSCSNAINAGLLFDVKLGHNDLICVKSAARNK